ncbi:hypothetical protein H7F50_19120 [Novosphingobium flavum]|uniref:Uncharacterized protein n=2 Tax=Novosphingobium aerophilum TaxID=2839843 RepID=A0A7X1KDJ9_9SPHN|nr:hypothetical protein [Novosphingobium aerophilum]MBC2663829.1 hypothetical protein [Novosphingobium aerophilum]
MLPSSTCSIRKRGGRKEMILPDAALVQHRHVDNTLIKGLARAFRWKKQLDTGKFATLGDLAASEKISPSYLTRILRLTLLAPEFIDAILDGQLGPETTLATLMEPFPIDWAEQGLDNRLFRS